MNCVHLDLHWHWVPFFGPLGTQPACEGRGCHRNSVPSVECLQLNEQSSLPFLGTWNSLGILWTPWGQGDWSGLPLVFPSSSLINCAFCNFKKNYIYHKKTSTHEMKYGLIHYFIIKKMKYRIQINYTSFELQMMFILGSAYSIHFKPDFCHNISFSVCIFTIKTEFNEQYKRHLKFWSFHHHACNMYEQLYLIGNNTEYRYLKN